ncbi:serine threonine- kinase pim-3-like protein [Labeo rohita]|uniref:non-specific serine/threonine protein kinase n=1 Tax=Labeo rohita TaxID=84645 RepID=A0A498L3V7_LABRO|nr:serine threonine- kinase pim-3-like protein [Labeo rohita]
MSHRSRSAAFTQTAGQEDGRRGSGDLDQDPLPNPNQPPSQGLPGYKAPLPYDLAVSVSTDQPHRKRKRQSSSQEDECPSTSQQRPAKRSRREAYAKGPLLGRGGFVMDCQLPSNLDIMDHLSLQEGHGRLLLEVALMTLVSSAPACPNVLQLLEWFDHRRRFTMILERPVPCQDLQSFCEENGHLDESLAKKVLLQVISALKHCKSRGVLHRNIKPENLLISTESHDIKLLDFGCGDLLKDSAYKYFAATGKRIIAGLRQAPAPASSSRADQQKWISSISMLLSKQGNFQTPLLPPGPRARAVAFPTHGPSESPFLQGWVPSRRDAAEDCQQAWAAP